MANLLKSLEGINSPYYGHMTLGTQRGDAVVPEDSKFPAIRVMDSHLTDVESIHLQVLKVENPEGEKAYLRRIVAKLPDGREMDIVDPVALDADLTETGIDTSKCEACGLPLDPLDLKMVDGKPYHRYCLEG
jgi:hypothetical protein